jgi:uncharacterized membrane protein
MQRAPPHPVESRGMNKFKRAGLAFVFIWFFAGGIGHFAATDFFVSIVPPWVPSPRAMVYVSGMFELIGAFALLSARLRPWAGWGLLLLIVCVTPANLYMWQHPQLFPKFPPALLSVRLLIQVLLIACVWWSTRPDVTPVNSPVAAR